MNTAKEERKSISGVTSGVHRQYGILQHKKEKQYVLLDL
jgi:hypothetical protein